jgi:hypothetical protein
MRTRSLLAAAKKHPITAEEYRRLKRRLLTARRNYVVLLNGLQNNSELTDRSAELRKMEQRMARLELRMAQSELVFPNEPSRIAEATEDALRKITRTWKSSITWMGKRLHAPAPATKSTVAH